VQERPPRGCNLSKTRMHLVTIAGSAGGFQALCDVLSALPATLDAAVVAMLHTGPGSVLPETLRSRSRLQVTLAASGQLLRAGLISVPPPGSHVIVNPDARLTLSEAPRRRLFRPSADWLFESAAASFGPRHVCVVLSGMLSDGAAMLREVKRLGGTVLAQSDALYSDMPDAAIATGFVDRVVPIAAMADVICQTISVSEAATGDAAWDDPFTGPLVA
jgi:two-component system, chemotaxis family, protein-glutamate methylesterase/glutaminase